MQVLAYCYTLLGHRVPISIRFWRADSLMGPLNGTFLGEGAQSIPGTIRIILIPNTQMSQFCPVTAPWFHNQFLNFELTRNLSWSWCIFCPFKDCLKSISPDKDCLKTKRLDTQFLMGHLKLHMSKWDRNVPLWIVTYIVQYLMELLSPNKELPHLQHNFSKWTILYGTLECHWGWFFT